MSRNATPGDQRDPLSRNQELAIERLVLGDTITRAAVHAGVSRETVHRWLSDDHAFVAFLNLARQELRDAAERRLLAGAEKAAGVLTAAAEQGDLRAALALLRGLGMLGGAVPAIGGTDPHELAEETRLARAEATHVRLLRSMMAGSTSTRS